MFSDGTTPEAPKGKEGSEQSLNYGANNGIM
jgi:hypothetical protein